MPILDRGPCDVRLTSNSWVTISLGMPLSYLHYDVFTGEALVGNQLAVFTDARGLDTAKMQRITREMNFSESTFILPAELSGTDIRMRIFTPMNEMPMAGHPTIGSTFALAQTGVIRSGSARFVFGLNIGPIPVDLEWNGGDLRFAWMTQSTPAFGTIVDDRAGVAATLGLGVEDLAPDLPVQEVSCGVPYPVRAASGSAGRRSGGERYGRVPPIHDRSRARSGDLHVFD